jgi:hypothetical protein
VWRDHPYKIGVVILLAVELRMVSAIKRKKDDQFKKQGEACFAPAT